MTPADVAYVRANYVSLQKLCESRADSVEATLALIPRAASLLRLKRSGRATSRAPTAFA